MADGQDSEWFFAGFDGFSLVLQFGLVWEPYGGRCTEANFLAVQNLHVFTVPLQCPYSALTVPLQFPYVKHTVPLPYWGQGKDHPHFLSQSPVG